jgi:ankyrin repeat protein
MAAARGLETCMRMIISKGGSCSQVSMHRAAQSGLAPALEILLKQGFPVNSRDEFGYNPLHFAAQKSKDAVRLLLDAGADVNARTKAGMTPLQFAIKSRIASKDVEGSIAHLLIKAGAKVN